VKGDDIAGTISETATLPIVIMVGAELCIGSIYDIYGRKKPLIITYFMASLGLFITPFFNSVYPWY
jgi:MFS family permease|tara:strand:+ start:210 stop:407 length:198 start_codon:yes stop_codon:yes gene_type:complete